jgi:hypothetical protein
VRGGVTLVVVVVPLCVYASASSSLEEEEVVSGVAASLVSAERGPGACGAGSRSTEAEASCGCHVSRVTCPVSEAVSRVHLYIYRYLHTDIPIYVHCL